ncbi:DUF6414 family protein [Haloarcula salinisoli]|uniref:Uncharacterized protein n=1 Tax=Haloarcula salinisoli TaxID=2487746 RepID=A0A8J7YFW1_9EURY|nr:hypothetical protein [Halomicroarcula salinisoli]MBX0304742.1 hypothetical protein [Halomicroarcula salinisoli]
MEELRDFIYLDDVSVNSHLSSLGHGVPSAITESEEDQEEKSGSLAGKIWGIGGEGGYSKQDINSTQTKLEITAPYRFRDLLSTLKDKGIQIHENPDPEYRQSGDMVRLEGVIEPMALFKVEAAVKELSEIFSPDLVDDVHNINQEPGKDGWSKEQTQQIQSVASFVEKMTGEEIPLRMKTPGGHYGVPLDRTKMRKDPVKQFGDEKEFTVIGRIDRTLQSGESWDPVSASSAPEEYISEDTGEWSAQLRKISSQFNLQVEIKDWELSGPSAIIHPIGLFW